jgi:hypothetical protein
MRQSIFELLLDGDARLRGYRTEGCQDLSLSCVPSFVIDERSNDSGLITSERISEKVEKGYHMREV